MPPESIGIEKIKYGGWPNCYRLANDLIELVVTTDVGPRIIHFSFVGLENEFHTFAAMLGIVLQTCHTWQ